MAPLYDTLSTAVYPTLTPEMAMKIGGKYKFSEVHARHRDHFVESAGLARAPARRRILELAKSLPPTTRELQSSGLSFAGNALVEEILVLIEQRCALTIKRLVNPTAESEKATDPSTNDPDRDRDNGLSAVN